MFCEAILAVGLLAVGATAGPFKRQDTAKKVFGHYMVGLTSGQTADKWAQDISDARNAGIDGFALNIGSGDAWNAEQIPMAYEAAEKADFSLFLSFDQAASTFTVDQINELVNQVKSYGSQFKVNDVPFVSTFEGYDFADSWSSVRDATGGIYLVPDWSSVGPDGVSGKLDAVDGACE